MLVLVAVVAVVLMVEKVVVITTVLAKQVVHILAVQVYILVYNHLHQELYHLDQVVKVGVLVVSVVAVELVEEVSLLVEL